MSSVAKNEDCFVWDLLDGKSESDSRFHRERATRELQRDAYEKMSTYDLHPMEYLNVCRDAVAREREDWNPTATADLIGGTEELIGVLDRCVITGTDGKSEVTVTQMVADNATNFGVALEGILEAVNGYLRQHYRITAEMVISIANNVLADQVDSQAPGVEHPAWCEPSQCHVYDGGESVVHRREFHDFDGMRLFTVSQCNDEPHPVIPDLDAGDFAVEEIPQLALALLEAYEHMAGVDEAGLSSAATYIVGALARKVGVGE